MQNSIGVIIGRFQAPELHAGHRELFEKVLENHSKLLVIVGNCDGPRNERYCLPYAFVQQMLQEEFEALHSHGKQLFVAPLSDIPCDTTWSRHVDHIIMSHFPMQKAILYGGRDSFIPCYHGRFQTVELELTKGQRHSATSMREQIAETADSQHDFRRGVIYSIMNLPPRIYPTVDIAAVYSDQVVLVRRHYGDWRFPGGYVDLQDESLERAAMREMEEEIGLTAFEGRMHFIASTTIQDWRATSKNKVLTSFFMHRFIGSEFKQGLKAADDVSEAKWFDIRDLATIPMAPDHHILRDKFLKHIVEDRYVE